MLKEWCNDVNVIRSGLISGLGTMCRLIPRAFLVSLTPAVFVTRSLSTECWKICVRGNLKNTTRIYQVVEKRSFIRTPCQGCMPICSMTCSVFAPDFFCYLGVGKGFQITTSNVETLISMRFCLFFFFFLDIAKTFTK